MNNFLEIGGIYQCKIDGNLYRYNGLIKDYDYTMVHEFECEDGTMFHLICANYAKEFFDKVIYENWNN